MADLFNPTSEHRALRELVRSFTEREVDPQAESSDRAERFNIELFRKLGDLGLLGVTVDERFGGSGLDPVAAATGVNRLLVDDVHQLSAVVAGIDAVAVRWKGTEIRFESAATEHDPDSSALFDNWLDTIRLSFDNLL